MSDRLEWKEEEAATGVLDIVLIQLAVIADVGEIDAIRDLVGQLCCRRPDRSVEPRAHVRCMLEYTAGNRRAWVDAETCLRVRFGKTDDILSGGDVVILRVKSGDAEQRPRSKVDLDIAAECVA